MKILAGQLPITAGFLLIFLPIAVVLYAIWPQSPYNPSPTTETIHGYVTMLTGDFVVVKTADGTNTIFSLRRGVTVDPKVQVGNEVIVLMAEPGQTVAIKSAHR